MVRFLKNILKLSVIILVIFTDNLDAVQVSLTQDSDKHIAYIHFVFEPLDAALFKETIKISIDHPSCEITKWHMLTQPTTQYFADFRTNKRVFTKNCDAEVILAYSSPNTLLHRAHLTISGIMHQADERNTPFSYLLPLSTQLTINPEKITLVRTNSDFSASNSYYFASTFTLSSSQFYDLLSEEFQLLDKLNSIWEEISQLFMSLFSFHFYVWWYCLLVAFFMLLLSFFLIRTLFARPVNKAWTKQGLECLTLMLCLSSLRFAIPLFAHHFSLFLASCTIIIGLVGFFSLVTSHEQSIWGKLKGVIAWVCLASILPMITYAYLSWVGLLR